MKYFIKTIVFFFLPFIAIIALYIVKDPYKIIYKYDEVVNTKKEYQTPGNRDVQSTILLLSQYKKQNYSSFILGNSRSFFYQASTWSDYVNGDIFHFNASGETLFGINGKINLLHELNLPIENVIIVLDAGLLKYTINNTGHIYIKHPEVSKDSYSSFHIEMFKGFFSKAFFAYIHLWIWDKHFPYMNSYGIRETNWTHDNATNQLYYSLIDKQLKNNTELYYKSKQHIFYERDTIQKYYEQVIYKDQIILLNNTISILKKHNTNYKIIISPLYDQKRINHEDLMILKELFGEDHVFDFSGINSITEDYKNYYEDSHYRPFICDSIISVIYK